MSDIIQYYAPEASIAEILRQFEEAGGNRGAYIKLPFKNVQGKVENVAQAREVTIRTGEKRWKHEATLKDNTGEIHVVLWNDEKKLLNNNDFVVIPKAEGK